ncbi:unnamed protein product [Leuciscus chuanchicus]
MQNSSTSSSVWSVCPSVSCCLSALWKMMRTSVCSSEEMDQSLDVPLSVEETRAEPAQSSVRPCSSTHEEECVPPMKKGVVKYTVSKELSIPVAEFYTSTLKNKKANDGKIRGFAPPSETVTSRTLSTDWLYSETLKIDALLADGSKFEANHGENVTLPFPMDKAEKADRLRIIFSITETTKNLSLIAQKCVPHEGCTVVDKSGVSVLVGGECVRVTIHNVNISRSGLYIAEAWFGKDVCEVKATLVVNKAPVSSSPAPPHSSSSPTPLSSSDLHWLYALIPVFIIIFIIILVFCCFYPVSQQKELENMIVSVAMNGCGEHSEALLTSS